MRRGRSSLIVIAVVVAVLAVALWFGGGWLMHQLKVMHGRPG